MAARLCRYCAAAGLDRLGLSRQGHQKLRALARLALDGNGPAMRFDDATRDGQAQAGALVPVLSPNARELVEEEWLVFQRDARPIVRDLDLYPVRRRTTQRDRDL